MAQTKPTFVIVPGAFHSASCYEPLFSALRSSGYETKTGTLKSVVDASKVLGDDIAFVKEELLLPLIEQEGKDVVVACHSYGGFPTSVAIAGLSKVERTAKGEKGGIIGLIYICAFVPREGLALFDMIGGKWAPWHVPKEDIGLIGFTNPHATFFADVPSALSNDVIANLDDHSMPSAQSPCPPTHYSHPAYDHGCRVYIRTAQDAALPVFVQDMMIEASACEWDVRRFETSHSPFLSVTGELRDVLVGCAEEWAGKIE
ncbi:MAG: hypothetical protein MMC33_008656 [Icmadophila ericetorum]|nr:hypothetical protein [Icmadophila ericetorum]